MSAEKGKWIPGFRAQVTYDGKIYVIQVLGRDVEAEKKLVDDVLGIIFALLPTLPTGSSIRGLEFTKEGLFRNGIFMDWLIDDTLSSKWASEFFMTFVEAHVRNVLWKNTTTTVLFELVKGTGEKFISVLQEKGN